MTTPEQNGKTPPTIDLRQPELLHTFASPDIGAMWARNVAYLQDRDSDRFEAIGGSTFGGFYDRDLVGWPFVIVGPPVFKTRTGNFGPQEVAELYVQRLSLKDGSPELPEVARFSGRYIVNKLKYLTQSELVGHVIWTLARNPKWPVIPTTKQHPLGLVPYDSGKDRPEIVESEPDRFQVGREFPTERATIGTAYARTETPAPVVTRQQEIEAAGGPVPPWAMADTVVRDDEEQEEETPAVRRGPGRPPKAR